MRPLLASLFDGLDGVTYFFVSSGIFVLLTAALFFTVGLWIGLLTWGRFKRRFRAGQEVIEDLKSELALLKRRTAELAARGFPPSKGRSTLAALVRSASPLQTPPAPGAAFTIWTTSDWSPQSASCPPLPPSAAFCLWPTPGPAVEIAHATGAANLAAGGDGEGLQFTDGLHSRSRRSENGDSASSGTHRSPAVAFQDELSGGTVRHDFLLGIVFNLPPQERDDLSQLDGISASERDALESFGVHRFKQIAHWNRDHAAEFARRLGLKDKSQAARWIGQAGELVQMAGGEISS